MRQTLDGHARVRDAIAGSAPASSAVTVARALPVVRKAACTTTLALGLAVALLNPVRAGAQSVTGDLPEPEQIRSPAQARDALQATAQARRSLQANWKTQNYNCYQRFAVNPCVSRNDSDRRVQESRLKAVEIQANKVLREERIIERNSNEAQQRGDRPAAAGSSAAQAAQAVQQREQRAADQRANAAERERAQRRQREQLAQQRAQRLQRERELTQRRAEHAKKLREAPAQAAKYRERLRENQEKVEQKSAEREQAAQAQEQKARK